MPLKKTVSQARYDSTHTKRFYLKLNLKTDADVITQLDSQESAQGYIKTLIRKDIAEQEKASE